MSKTKKTKKTKTNPKGAGPKAQRSGRRQERDSVGAASAAGSRSYHPRFWLFSGFCRRYRADALAPKRAATAPEKSGIAEAPD